MYYIYIKLFNIKLYFAEKVMEKHILCHLLRTLVFSGNLNEFAAIIVM